MDPGVYCGGLTIKKDANVELRPGVYIFKDGPLLATDRSILTGKNVGLYFTGDRATLNFQKATTIELTAPKTGPMAGLLMFSDRTNSESQRFIISSDKAGVLLGTIYLPNAQLYIDSSEAVGNQSAYTVIVSRYFEATGGPTVTINSDYNSTDIPVPDGVGLSNEAGKVVLVQ